jgi:formamidopyrimidine-DNA glycosylase
MPELPEVETVRRALTAHLVGRRIRAVVLRRPALRWPIPAAVGDLLPGQRVEAVRRRAKYLLIDTAAGSALVHLGMSGSLRLEAESAPLRPHDHVELHLDDGRALRFRDPRRFGALLWQPPTEVHPLLAGLGPEPLSRAFGGGLLLARSRGRSAPVKSFLMDQAVVVGVGNIYAAEALFAAGIDPRAAAGLLSRARCERLAQAVKRVLARAIRAGGTTLRDYVDPVGEPGRFSLELYVYGREGEPCRRCGAIVRGVRLAGRASAYCPRCQR